MYICTLQNCDFFFSAPCLTWWWPYRKGLKHVVNCLTPHTIINFVVFWLAHLISIVITSPTATDIRLLSFYTIPFIFPWGNSRTVVSRSLQTEEAVNFSLPFHQKKRRGRRRLYAVHFSGWQNYMAERKEMQQPFIMKSADRLRAFTASHAAVFHEMTSWQNHFATLLSNQSSQQTVIGWQ
jgi:hypothetical protein